VSGGTRDSDLSLASVVLRRLGRVPDAVNDAPEFADRITLALAGGASDFGNGEGMCCVSRAPAPPYP
jgi:hypothetical protein